jgi:hypothetical protein
MLEYAINVLARYTFRGKLRLFDPFVPSVSARAAEVFDYEMKLDLAGVDQRRNIYLSFPA